MIFRLKGTEYLKSFHDESKRLGLAEEMESVLDALWYINTDVQIYAYPEPRLFSWKEFEYYKDDWRKLLEVAKKHSEESLFSEILTVASSGRDRPFLFDTIKIHVGHRLDRRIDRIVDLQDGLPAIFGEDGGTGIATGIGAFLGIFLAELIMTDRRSRIAGECHIGRRRMSEAKTAEGEKSHCGIAANKKLKAHVRVPVLLGSE